MNFNELIKNEKVRKAIEELNFDNPTDIQNLIMPLIVNGEDVLGQSKTGTGKTLAFAGPILDKVSNNSKVQALILSPTRELAIQIASDINIYAKYLEGINTLCVYGSSSIESQIKALNKGSEIVVGTPGRVKDLIKRGKLKLDSLKFFVLDEADEMLSMGFQEEIEDIFRLTQDNKQVLLFSATMPDKILSIAKHYMKKDYKTVKVVSLIKTADNILQEYYITSTNTRVEALARVLDYYDFNRVMIFVRTKKNADDLLDKLIKRGYSVSAIHGDISQEQRIKILNQFRSGSFKYLIATDVASRGIHVDDIDLVINYSLPDAFESYVHRIGRTGRANKKGMSITFVTKREEKDIFALEKFTHSKIILKELPKKEDILDNKLKSLYEEIEVLKKKDTNKKIDNVLKELDEKDILKIGSNLLEDKLYNNMGSCFDVVIDDSKKSKKRKETDNDSIRVFLTIGSLDNIQKREFLSFIEKKASLKEGTCFGVEILSKFTFMNVKRDFYDAFYRSINNCKYNGRVIKVEKARK